MVLPRLLHTLHYPRVGTGVFPGGKISYFSFPNHVIFIELAKVGEAIVAVS